MFEDDEDIDEIDLEEMVEKSQYDREDLREAIRAELEAINQYEKVKQKTDDPDVEDLMQHVIEEEKHHVGEFYELLQCKDVEQAEEHEEAKDDVQCTQKPIDVQSHIRNVNGKKVRVKKHQRSRPQRGDK